MTHATQAEPHMAELLHESKIMPMQWVILVVCFVAYLIDGFDIVIIAFTAPAITAEWALSAQKLGIVFSAGLLGMTLGAMFLSTLSDIYGRRNISVIMLFMAGIATSAAAYVETVTQLIALRLVAGLALGALVASLAPLASEFSPVKHRTLIVSIMLAGGSLGPMIGGLLTGPAIEAFGWRMVFLYTGLITIVVSILILLIVPESMAFLAKRKGPAALDRINKGLRFIGQTPLRKVPPSKETGSTESISVRSLLTAARYKATLLAWMAFFFGFAVTYFLSSWVPQLLTQAGYPQKEAIEGAVVLTSGSIVGTALLGWLARWWALNRIIAASFGLAAASMLALSILLGENSNASSSLIWGCLFITGVTMLGGFANLYTLTLTIYPTQIRSTGLGWCAGLGRCGAVISPTVAGVLVAGGVTIPDLFVYFVAAVLLAALAVFVLPTQELP